MSGHNHVGSSMYGHKRVVSMPNKAFIWGIMAYWGTYEKYTQKILACDHVSCAKFRFLYIIKSNSFSNSAVSPPQKKKKIAFDQEWTRLCFSQSDFRKYKMCMKYVCCPHLSPSHQMTWVLTVRKGFTFLSCWNTHCSPAGSSGVEFNSYFTNSGG